MICDCEYGPLRKRAEDAEFDLKTMELTLAGLIKQLDDLKAEFRSTESVLRAEPERLKRAMVLAHDTLKNSGDIDDTLLLLAVSLDYSAPLEQNLTCVHGREGGLMCPHCMGMSTKEKSDD